ncbi:MAG: lectin-like protein [Kiritimatiellales bacterium]|nr:lectin-like protein [Kiritimatiellales bacterium]
MKRNLNCLIWITVGGLLGAAFAEIPQWWQERGVLNTNRPAHDFNPVNQGQVKWMCTQAYEELQEKLPNPGNTNILNRIDAFPAGNNFRPANQGMLKAVALPVYQRLIEEGYASGFPWDGSTNAAHDFALANQGQLKNLFNFDLDAFDSDGDGLPNYIEIGLGLSPGKADTDEDGLSDFEEVSGSVYTLVNRNLTWSEAKADAEMRGGHLATVTSEAEHAQIAGCIALHPVSSIYPWIGATDEEEEGVWTWITGEPFEYARWNINEPSNTSGVEHYAQYWKMGLWNDASGAVVRPYILEYEHCTDPLVSDSDGDGILDGEELRIGSNPQMRDTDGDGVEDAIEIANGLDPALADTDGDRLSDFAELNGPTDPLNPDCDNDGLLDGEESRFVLVSDHRLSWPEAKADAELRGGYLATVTSEAEHNEIITAIGADALYRRTPWIGAADEEETGVWTWVTGEPFAYTLWGVNDQTGVQQPDTNNVAAHYVFYKQAAPAWFNGSGDHCYLIEHPRSLDPLNPDSDGDGLLDGEEIKTYHSSPFVSDTDGDGLTDPEEAAAGTSPVLADTDADGLTDVEELAGSTDPVNPDTDGDGLKDGLESRYILVGRYVTWAEAKADAELRGGHLAALETEEEYNDVVKRFGITVVKGTYTPWLGASDEEEEGVWKWNTGEPFTYTVWSNGQPSNGNDEDYLQFWPNAQWGDRSPDFRSGYLIEFDQALDPLNPDTDGDGLSDGDEVLVYFTNPFAMDTDADGIADQTELDAGMNPCSPDSDRDGLTEPEETAVGLDPLNPDGDGDGLLDGEEVLITLTSPFDIDSNTNGVPDLRLITSIPGSQASERVDYIEPYIEFLWEVEGDALVLSKVDQRAYASYSLSITNAGIYRIAFQTAFAGDVRDTYEPRIEIYVDECFAGELFLNTSTNLPEYTGFTPWLTAGSHKLTCRIKGPSPGGPFTIESVELYAVDGEDANGNGIPDWMEQQLDRTTDLDKDGLSDADEVLIYGTNPLSADTDGDGLSDDAELMDGTDPAERDTDHDGVDDGTEREQALTDPLVADFGQRTDVVSVNGNQSVGSVGDWVKEGSIIYSVGINGSLDYQITVPAPGHYAVEFEIADHSTYPESDPFDLSLAVDGVQGRPVLKQVPNSGTAQALFFPPYLTAGEHTFRLIWSNLNPAQHLEIRAVRLAAYDGPDVNENGQADWIDSREENSFSLDTQPVSSPVSPVCIEGSSLFVDLLSISNSFAFVDSSNHWVGAQKSINRGWYANAGLSPTGETTLSFAHNGVVEEQVLSVDWEETNLMAVPTNTVTVRLNDALLFNVLPDTGKKKQQGSLVVTIEGPSGTTNLVSLTDQPIPWIFEEPGLYTVSGLSSKSRAVQFDDADPVNEYGFRNGHPANGVFNNGNTSTSDVFYVNVVDWRFNGNPSCLKDSERSWECPDIAGETLVEQDASLAVTRSLSGENGTRFELLSSIDTEQCMIARLSEGGPIAAYALINTITQYSSEFYRVVEEFADGSDLLELTLAFGNIPDDFRIRLDIFVGGVVFLDGTVEKEFTKADFDEQGVLKVLMVTSIGKNSDCHHVKIFQGDTQL